MTKFHIKQEISEYRITNQDLKNIEKIRSCKLPNNYSGFLLKNNGGKTNWNSFKIKNYFLDGKSNFGTVRCFYGICPDKNSIMHNYDIFSSIDIRGHRIPLELLPIATDSFGNEICLCVHGEKYETVYFWDHENEAPDGQEPWWENIYLISDNFTEFLNNLYEYDIDEKGNEIRRYQDGTVSYSKYEL